ncbi:MAG: hypothetical protein ACK48H_06835 [Microcystis sp.]
MLKKEGISWLVPGNIDYILGVGVISYQLSVIGRQETGDRRQETGDWFYLFSPLPTSPIPHSHTSPLPKKTKSARFAREYSPATFR